MSWTSVFLNPWVIVGFIGQALFSARFVVQWIASERAKRSIVPEAFWIFSIAGGVVLLSYAIYRRDPVFIAGQGAGLAIYTRNVVLILREKAARRRNQEPDSAA